MRCVSASKSNSCTPARLRSHFTQVTVCPTCTRCQAGELRARSVLRPCTHLGLTRRVALKTP